MKLSEIVPLFGAVLNLLLALFVFTRNARGVVNRVFGLLGTCFAIWNFGTFWMFRVTNAHDALFWARFLQFGVIFMPVCFLHLSLLIAGLERGKYIAGFYVVSVLLALSNFTDFFLRGVRNVGYAWYSVAGPGFWVVSFLYLFLWLSIFILIRRRRSLSPLQRSRLTPLIVAQLSLTLFGDNDILPILGIDYYPFTHFQIYPFGSMVVIFYGAIVGYSVLQHQLLDVHVTLGRVAANAVRIGFIFVVGFLLLLAITLFNPGQFTTISFLSAMIVLLASTTFGSIYFPRIFGKGPEAWERRFLGDRFEYHDQLRGFIGNMQWYTSSENLLDDLHELLANTVHIKSYQIILPDETNQAFSIYRSHPPQASTELPDLKMNSAVFRFFEATGVEYLAFNLVYAVPGSTSLEREAREILKHFNAEFCLPFISEEEPFGLMLLGPKQTEEPYTATDISLMVSLVRNLSLIINQIRLKTQILQAQEMELLGRMSRGMAHDMNNLVTPVQTLLQLMNEGVSTQHLREDLLPVAMRSIETMREYVREALFFSENARPDFKLGRLDVLLAEAADITEPRRSAKAINVAFDPQGDVLVEMDKSLILRMVVNIIANAVDASPPHSTVRIELVRLLKTEAQRDWMRVRVIDSGEGIKPEDMNRIFTPYFTTKDRGDKERGFGLGLSICRKVVQLHGGYLNVVSQRDKGTTVQIDLPDRQIMPTVPAMLASISDR